MRTALLMLLSAALCGAIFGEPPAPTTRRAPGTLPNHANSRPTAITARVTPDDGAHLVTDATTVGDGDPEIPPDLAAQVHKALGAKIGNDGGAESGAAAGGSAAPLTAPIKLSPAAATPITPALASANGATHADSSESASQDRVDVLEGGLLDVRFYNTELFLALELLGDQTGRNIVLQPGATGSVNVTLRRVTYAQALDAIMRANNLEATVRDGVTFVRPAPQPDAAAAGKGPVDMRMFRLSHVGAVEVETFIKPLLSPEGRIAKTPAPELGIGSSKEKAGGMSPAMGDVVVIVDHPENLKIIEQAITEIDVRPQQVLVEATIMRATLNDQNALGIEFNTLAGVDFQMLAANSPGVASVSLGPVPQPQLQNTSVAARTEFNSAIPAGGFTFGVVKDQVAAFIRALEQVTDVTILANPKVLTLNKQRGEIIVGRRDGYLTTTVTETSAVQTVEFLETGTRLLFRPYVTRDGYVRMEIHPEDSNGGLTAANLPFQETTEATTNIEIKDGHTILIGGLFRERSTVGKSQIPGLGSLPIVGPIFGVNQSSQVREEVVILLTVHVLDNSTAEERAMDDMVEDAERMRVAARTGLSGLGRDQFAEAHYQAAVNLARAGKVDDALFNLRLSLGLRPRHLDAIRLHERLTNERTWNSDGSLVRSFIRARLREKAGLPAQDGIYDRPAAIPFADCPDRGNDEPCHDDKRPPGAPSDETRDARPPTDKIRPHEEARDE